MRSLTVVEAFGRTLEAALEQAVGPVTTPAGPAQAGCLVCGGETASIPVRGGHTLVSCRDCRSTIETTAPDQVALRLAS